jgi:hypothetical protein
MSHSEIVFRSKVQQEFHLIVRLDADNLKRNSGPFKICAMLLPLTPVRVRYPWTFVHASSSTTFPYPPVQLH